jgi:hypothetical protein
MKTMEKSPKKYYWAVFAGNKIAFEGSFNECWKWFVQQYSQDTIGWLHSHGVCVARQA